MIRSPELVVFKVDLATGCLEGIRTSGTNKKNWKTFDEALIMSVWSSYKHPKSLSRLSLSTKPVGLQFFAIRLDIHPPTCEALADRPATKHSCVA